MPSQLGVIFATTSLAIGLFFFVFYAVRYYLFSAAVLSLSIIRSNGHNGNGNGSNGNGNGRGMENHRSKLPNWVSGLRRNGNGDGNHNNGSGGGRSSCLPKLGVELIVEPFVSIHLPLFNEPNVAERILTACTTLDYTNYEVIVIDDSTDETIDILRKWVESNNASTTLVDGGQRQVQVAETLIRLRTPLKIIHRNLRSGFKGGALNEALRHMNPKAEYVIVFDADFIPPPDIIRRFLAYFMTTSPTTIVKALLKLDKEYAQGNITLDEYFRERLNLTTKIVNNGLAMESFHLAHHSLFELDQLFAERAIDQTDYLLHRKAIMRELSKSSLPNQLPENKLALKQAFTICKLFSEDKIDLSDFKARMRMISPATPERRVKAAEEPPLFLQISELDQQLAKGAIDINTYNRRRTALAVQLLNLTEDPEELKTRFELDQQLAQGKISPERYLKKRNGSGHSATPGKIVHLTSKVNNGGGGNGNSRTSEISDEFVAVQGYQLHYLNRSENWLTQGIRAEFSGSYMIERTCEEILGAMKMIAGSVYMIKADALRKYGWSESITEDWELTCRLYRDGSRVIYSPAIQAPAECPSTINRLIRQRQRWAEGHTYNAKRYFWGILRSPHVTIREKLEFVYFAPYYLQSVFFIAGTFLWLVSEYLHEYPPFWNQTFGWALLLSNLMALPLMNVSGLISEGTAKKDFTGIFSAIVLSYILSVFQAYAALKGLFEKKEGTWVRTYKTGVITETMRKFQLDKFWKAVTKPRHKRTKAKASAAHKPIPPGIKARFVSFVPRGRISLSLVAIILLGLTLLMITGLSQNVRETSAIPSNTKWYFYNNGGPIATPGTLSETAPSAGSQSIVGGTTYYWATTSTYSVSSADSGTWIFHLVYSSMNYPGSKTITLTIYLSSSRTTLGSSVGSNTLSSSSLSAGGGTIDVNISVTASTGTYYVQFSWSSDAPGSKSLVMTTSNVGSTLTVPENALLLGALVPLIPFVLRRISNRSRRGKSSALAAGHGASCENAVIARMVD
jgi:cellulose synthase/poly-beta-1,6-N-acetylglucosamine synthase-like glycosyltransferase